MQNTSPPPAGKLKDRLAWARERKSLTQQQLAKLSKVAQSTIASWENGARETGRKITALADPLDVDELWLATGKGSPYRNARATLAPVTPKIESGLPEQLRAQVFLGHLSEREAALLHKFRMSSEEGKRMFETVANNAPRDQLALVDNKAQS